MTMDPGTSKVDVYQDCLDPTCRMPLGKAHVHPMQGTNSMAHLPVVVRRQFSPQSVTIGIIDDLFKQPMISKHFEKQLLKIRDLVMDWMPRTK